MTVPVRAVVNRHRRLDLVPPPPGDEVLAFHQQFPGYRPTPLRELPSAGPGIVWLKDESDRLGLQAFKVLGASWAIEQTLSASPGVHTLIAASAGNHGRAVARIAAHRHVACTIYLPRTASSDSAEAISRDGAEVIRVDGGYDAAVANAEREAQRPGAALIADTGRAASAAWVIDGYTTLFREAAMQTREPFDLIIAPIGVGALAACAVRFGAHLQPGAAVIGVEPETAACVTSSLQVGHPVTVPTPGTSMTGMDCGTPSAKAWPTLRDGLAGTVTVTDAEAHDAMRELAVGGVSAGDCGAATVAGLRALRDDVACDALRAATGFGRSSSVLCLVTEGAERGNRR